MDFFRMNDFIQTPSLDMRVTETGKKTESLDFVNLFSGFASQGSNLNHRIQSDDMQTVTPTEKYQVKQSAADRLNIKDAKDSNDLNEKITEDVAKDIVEFKEKIISVIKEETGMDETEITDLLDELSISIAQLLNPQQLAQVVAQLTGEESVTALLMDGNFANLMGELTVATEEFSDMTGLNSDEMTQVLSQMNFDISAEEITEIDFSNLPQTDVVQPIDSNAESKEGPVEMAVVMEETTVNTKDYVQEEKGRPIRSEQTTESEEAVPERETVEVKVDDRREESKGFESRESDQPEHEMKHEPETPVIQPSQTPQSVPVNEFVSNTVNYLNSYISNPESILEQITSNLKLTLEADTTTMEMQLNPENLGKVFLQVSSKEGVVSAHIAAQNDAVKEVLEAQMATLRENLNQQGVKVDAIEVTVSSHGFEKNLEDGQQRQQQEGQMQEAQKQTRRSLRLDSLDELSGLMSEEEMLVAQIMRDNGNTMDLTA